MRVGLGEEREVFPSMKVPPKRKGNLDGVSRQCVVF